MSDIPGYYQRETGHGSRPRRLLQVVHEALRAGHYSYLTEKAYVSWIRRYIRFHGCRHPRDMGAAEITTFLTHLSAECAFRPMTDRIPNRWRTPFRRHGGQCSVRIADTLAAAAERC